MADRFPSFTGETNIRWSESAGWFPQLWPRSYTAGVDFSTLDADFTQQSPGETDRASLRIS